MIRRVLSAIVCSLLLAGVGGAGATTIYKSVDSKGRVTFSDQPPTRDELVDVIEYESPPPNTSALDRERIEAMRAVTERMAADRREREASRAEARQAAIAAAARRETAPLYLEESDNYYPLYLPRRHRPGRFPGHGHRPGYGPGHGHPPHLKPPMTAGFNQYPASLVRRHYTGVARRVFYPEPFYRQ